MTEVSVHCSDEAAFFVERAILADLGLRVGYVWKKDYNGWQQMNDGRPFSAYNVPVTITESSGLARTAETVAAWTAVPAVHRRRRRAVVRRGDRDERWSWSYDAPPG